MAVVGDNAGARNDPEVVAPLSKLRGMIGGGMSIVINMPPGSNGEDVVRAIQRYERLNGTAWRKTS